MSSHRPARCFLLPQLCERAKQGIRPLDTTELLTYTPGDVAGPTHQIMIRVRYTECDPMGLAHHSAYAPWFEMGRIELLRTSGLTYNHLTEAHGITLAVVELLVRYRRPIRYDDQLRLVTTLTEVGHVRIRHKYELWRDSRLATTGRTTLACVGPDGRVVGLPDVLRRHADGTLRIGDAAASDRS